ncbi:WD domain-containing protein [Colletotrichum graminicola]|uniref:WD domain-containing protein n=1 Tax=Colletotrichum graminicola (strain M1.001 / M2 / FGSC 10212) TaxID=645133 RepID=E3QF95_COLGM|nr:WD domain-containing protein [Colletotrichum graminicola M1.001]EFQ29533.1 WD domain-containing protein [Colletotrichum graminicola M1.001]WDK23512.1 WD domain-containing protein [Colletotrichum graminicola]
MDNTEENSRSPYASTGADEDDGAATWTHHFEQDAEDVDEEDYDSDFQDEPDEDDEEDDEEYHDADDGGERDVEIEVFMGAGDEDDSGEDDASWADNTISSILTLVASAGGVGTRLIRGTQVLGLMQGGGEVILHSTLDDFDDDEDMGWGGRRRRGHSGESSHSGEPSRFPKVPSDEGTKLMYSGVFGANEQHASKKQLARRILDRELGLGDRRDQKQNQDLMAQGMIPSTNPEMIVHYDDPVYSGQFSDDGNFFYACGHDFKVRMYDTSNPYNWRYYKTVNYPWGQWTLTDASLSPDNRWLAYTSIQSNVCLAPTDPNDTGDPYTLDLAERSVGTRHGRRSHSFGIWSVRFSGDGRELVAGTNTQSIVVYDIESRTVLHNVVGHEDDVNAVCFADKSSPHILYSGSDDATIKVWDRRSMGDGRPAGAFVGHVEGLTYIDSKGDGRYILSNGKDQTMKLWDLRMVMSTAEFDEANPTRLTAHSNFDYRWGTFRDVDWFPHPNDNSVVTFRGHRVMRTLIRCHFSPPSSTNSRYVYSGSQDGKVYIWNLDATLAGTIDVRQATKNSRPLERRYRIYHGDDFPGWDTCVRDVSWHPNAPVLVASAWNGFNMAHGTCTLHSYNEAEEDEADPPMGRSVDEKLRPVGSAFQM